MEVDEKSSDEKSSRSESPPSPPNEQQSPIKGSPLLEGKRRLREFETEEEYEERKKARRANMNYVINFGESRNGGTLSPGGRRDPKYMSCICVCVRPCLFFPLPPSLPPSFSPSRSAS